jgi:hypothetical protein
VRQHYPEDRASGAHPQPSLHFAAIETIEKFGRKTGFFSRPDRKDDWLAMLDRQTNLEHDPRKEQVVAKRPTRIITSAGASSGAVAICVGIG